MGSGRDRLSQAEITVVETPAKSAQHERQRCNINSTKYRTAQKKEKPETCNYECNN